MKRGESRILLKMTAICDGIECQSAQRQANADGSSSVSWPGKTISE